MGELQQWTQGKRQPGDAFISLGLLGVALVLLTINLGGLPLRDWDEGLVAQVAREISQSDFDSLTWLHPTLWDEPYFNKPPLIHWLIALAYRVGGVNEWTARLPGAILTALSVPLLYGIGREVFYLRLPALLTALVYLTSLPVVRQGRLAMLDGAILCFLMLMVVCLLWARRDLRYALGFGLGFTLICLTKGIMVGGLLVAIGLVFIAWDTPRLLRLPYLWLGLFLGSLPVILWYGAQVTYYGQEFLGTNLLNQSLKRVWTGVESNSGAPWYYLLEILKYSAPWLLFLPLGCKRAWENRNLSWAKLAIVWGGLYLVVISLMVTKLPWYVLPLYPALALIVGAELAALWQKGKPVGSPYWDDSSYSPIWAGLFIFLGVAATAGAIYFINLSSPREPDVGAMLVALAITMTLTAILVVRKSAQFLAVLIWGSYLTLLLLMISDHWVWELAETYPVKPVAALVQQYTPAGEKVYTSYPNHRPSLNFYSQHLVIPANQAELRRVWRRQPQPYLLLDQANLEQLNLRAEQVVGTAEGWSLVTKSGS